MSSVSLSFFTQAQAVEQPSSKITPISSLDQGHILYDNPLYIKTARVIDELRSRYLSDPLKERQRLEVLPRIQPLFQNDDFEDDDSLSGAVFSELSLEAQITVARSIELLEAIKGDYFVFNHGVSRATFLLHMLTTKLYQSKYPENNFLYLRHQCFLDDIPSDHDVKWYLKNHKKVKAFDHHFFNELMSVDAYLENETCMESAISLLEYGVNICINQSEVMEDVVKRIFSQYTQDELKIEQFTRRFFSIMDNTYRTQGMLYSICVPKERFHHMGYLSRRYGHAHHYLSSYHITVMQEGYSQREKVKKLLEKRDVPQIRLLPHKLKPEEGVFIIPHCTFSPLEEQYIQRSLNDLVKGILEQATEQSA